MVTLRDLSLFLKANSCFQLKENGNVLGFNLVADIVALVNWNQVVQWYEAYHPQDVKSSFERCLFLLFIQAFAEKKHVEVIVRLQIEKYGRNIFLNL